MKGKLEVEMRPGQRSIRAMSAPARILFLCTANYYRSRFAEYYWNHLAAEAGLPVLADSAGLEMARWRDYNPGVLSPHARAALESLGVPVEHPPRAPRQFDPNTLSDAVRVIALCEREHRPMVARSFPDCLSRIEFWSVEDVEVERPEVALRRIQSAVAACLEAYR